MNRFRFRAWHKQEKKMLAYIEPFDGWCYGTDGTEWHFSGLDGYQSDRISQVDADHLV